MRSDTVTVVVHQPDFIPYLGFFHRLLSADVWVVLDNVQLNREGWVHRDQVKTQSGVKWLTIPLKRKGLGLPIAEIECDESNWHVKHLRRWQQTYRKSSFYDEIFPYVERVYALDSIKLSEFTYNSILILLEVLDIKITKTLFSYQMDTELASNALVADLVCKAGGTHYLSGTGAQAYFDPVPYAKAGVEVVWQEFTHPVYPQLYGEFVPYLTVFDALFNCGVEGTQKLLRCL